MAVLFNPFLIPIVALIGYFLYRMVDSIAQAMSASSQHRDDAELKMTLANRGMSAEEIQRVVSVGREPGRGNFDETAPYPQQAPLHQTNAYYGEPLPPHKRPSQTAAAVD